MNTTRRRDPDCTHVPPRVLPDDACPACGTMMRETRGRMRLTVSGEEISVPCTPHLRCPNCGEIVLRFHDARQLHEKAAIHRKKALTFFIG